MTARFDGNFTQPEGLSEEAIARAVEVMRSGRLHRYNVVADETPETVELEREFARYVGAPYCLACASGGYALQTALRAYGIVAGEVVLTNAFTLSPVPGAIAATGARAVLVETTRALVIDLDDLERKARASRARVLMLSHMRGHIVDMDALMARCVALGLDVIEDCAHTMGARWADRPSGSHGIAACYSTQTYKHINSGEGGLLTTRDAELMARATVLSGSYMLYERHVTVPSAEVFADVRLDTPNCSGRMDNLRAAILRPQLRELDHNVARWNERYDAVAARLQGVPGIELVERAPQEYFVGSSIQFLADRLDADGIIDFVALCSARGVELKWFGAAQPQGYTSRHDSWRYLDSQVLPNTDAVLGMLCDMRVSLTFSVDDCVLIGDIIAQCMNQVHNRLRQAG